MDIPRITIRQQMAKIGINTEPGRMEIRQPRPELRMESKPVKVNAHYRKADLSIDQSASWEALGKGDVHHFTGTIADEARRIVLEEIGNIVDRGNRMAQIHTGTDVIAELAYESVFEDFYIAYEGPFTNDSVEITAVPRKPDVEYVPGELTFDPILNPPSLEFIRGKVDVYLRQKAAVTITPPELDLKI